NIYSRGSAFFMIVDMRGSLLSPGIAQFLICVLYNHGCCASTVYGIAVYFVYRFFALERWFLYDVQWCILLIHKSYRGVLCGCCASTVYGIAVHFVYRFFALERHGRLSYFKGKWQILWYSIPILAGLNWNCLCFFVFDMNPQSTNYLRPIVQDVFNLNIEDTSYAASLFWPENTVSWDSFNWEDGIGLINCIVLMQISFFVILWMGAKSPLKIKDLVNQGVSQYSKDLQVQLYKALVVQTLIPTIFIFIPFGIFFICPFFLIDCEFLSGPITIFYAIYPALDPLPILFFIDIYRDAVREMFCSKWKSNKIEVEAIQRNGENHSTENSF
ncbi:hypothetical protein CAEBREN_31988, partial [Caenorhabditis brenneri]